MRDIYPVICDNPPPLKWRLVIFIHDPSLLSIHIPTRPPWWYRLCARVFLGWKWVPIKETK